MLTILSGLVAGAAHVVTGPDHLAALAPIAVQDPGRAAKLGFRWGLGHGIGVLLLGLLGMFARDWVAVEALSTWAEVCVGFVLVIVGGWALQQLWLFWLAPLVGGAFGGFAYKALGADSKTKPPISGEAL